MPRPAIWRPPAAIIPTASSPWPCARCWRTDYPIGRPPGTSGETTAFLSPSPPSKTGWKGRGKKEALRLAESYEPWVWEGFSGYLAADEIYDGPFCVLYAVDSNRQRRLAYEVLDTNPTQEIIRQFFLKVRSILTTRNLTVAGITTDGSPLYPEPIRAVFPEAAHQVCEFHVLKEITLNVLRALAKIRRALAAQIPKLSRGRPSTPRQKTQARLAKQLRRRVGELFANRYLLVQHGLTFSEARTLRRLSRWHRDLRPLRQLMDEIYRLFDRRCRTDTAQAKLAKLRSRLVRFSHLGKVLAKIQSPNLDKALTFLDDKCLEATSNSVERVNRRHRKMQKSIYRVRTKQSLTSRIALDMLRDREMVTRETLLANLHTAREMSSVIKTY